MIFIILLLAPLQHFCTNLFKNVLIRVNPLAKEIPVEQIQLSESSVLSKKEVVFLQPKTQLKVVIESFH